MFKEKPCEVIRNKKRLAELLTSAIYNEDLTVVFSEDYNPSRSYELPEGKVLTAFERKDLGLGYGVLYHDLEFMLDMKHMRLRIIQGFSISTGGWIEKFGLNCKFVKDLDETFIKKLADLLNLDQSMLKYDYDSLDRIQEQILRKGVSESNPSNLPDIVDGLFYYVGEIYNKKLGSNWIDYNGAPHLECIGQRCYPGNPIASFFMERKGNLRKEVVKEFRRFSNEINFTKNYWK